MLNEAWAGRAEYGPDDPVQVRAETYDSTVYAWPLIICPEREKVEFSQPVVVFQ
jgi:hypothetical protein